MSADVRTDLVACAADLSATIEAMKRRHAASPAAEMHSVYEMTTPDGSPLLAPMLAALAQVLVALADYPETIT
jgi:hypothetical protein